MRALASLSVRRPVSVLMTALAAIAFGIVAYQRLSLDLLPDLKYPSFTVRTEYEDTAPAEIENLITRPVEEEVGVLGGLQSIRSVSRSGVSEVTLEFDWKADLEMLSMEIREKLDRLDLPLEAGDPIVLRYDPALDPIMRIAYTGGEDLNLLRRVAERTLQPELEVALGVAAAQIRGGLEDEIQIDVDQERMAALGLSINQIQSVVATSNLNLPGGTLESAESRLLIRLVNEYDSLEEIRNLLIRAPSENSGAVRLGDVATVIRGSKEREEITRFRGEECVEIAIYKEGEANTVESAAAVRRKLEQLREKLPEGHELSILFDQSRFIERSITEVRNAALIGGLLAVVILLVFLRDIPSTAIIAISIPLSIIVTFIAMYRLGVSLNIMSLGGLTLGIGMLVDNSIVVLESIHRKRESGMGRARAAIEGTAEVGGAVVASTLTSIAVFLPILFVEGIAGQIFGDLSLTVTFSLLASLLIAITLIPTLSGLGSRFDVAKASGRGDSGGSGGSVGSTDSSGSVHPEASNGADAPMGAFASRYTQLLKGALARPALTLMTAFVLLLLSLGLVPLLGTELLPEVNEGEFFFEVRTPEGSPLELTDRVMTEMERKVEETSGIGHYYATIGRRQVTGGLSLNDQGENLAQLNVVVDDRSNDALQEEAIRSLRSAFTEIPDQESRAGRPSYFSLRTPIEILIFGEDIDDLRDYSLALTEAAQEVDGLTDIRSSLESGSPELRVRFDREKVARLGLDLRQLSETLRDRVFGSIPTRFKESDRQVDIRVRNQESDRGSVGDVRSLVLDGPDGAPIRLSTIAQIESARGPAEIHRIQQQRAAVVSANVSGISLGAGLDRMESVLQNTPPPPGISTELGGQGQEMGSSFRELVFATALALFLVYLVMAGTFESLLHPFIILFTVPLALIGVVLGLYVTGTSISVIVLIGAIMLVGIVVNNAIVLIDRINQLRRGGMEKTEAVLAAARTRLRPILMTSTTTVLGLLPMAFAVGQGSELRSPLAVTVSAGLILATALTLLVIPAAYQLVPSTIRPQPPVDEPDV